MLLIYYARCVLLHRIILQFACIQRFSCWLQAVLARRFSFVVIVTLLHTLVNIVKIVRSYHCLFVAVSIFFLLLFLLPFVMNKNVHYC